MTEDARRRLDDLRLLDGLRRAVEGHDVEIVGRLIARRDAVRQIQELKAERELQARDPAREVFLRALWFAQAGKLAGEQPHAFWVELGAVFDQVLDFCAGGSAILRADEGSG